MFGREMIFICNEEGAKELGTWFIQVGVKVLEIKEVIIEEQLNWVFRTKMNLIDRLMYKIDFEKGI